MLENLLDTTLSFYRDTFDVLQGTIPTSATYSITFPYATYFSVTATSDEDVVLYLTGDYTEEFYFYANQTEAKQGRIPFSSLTAMTSSLSTAGGTVHVVTTNQYGKPLKVNWLIGSYACKVLERHFLFPYTPLGEVDKQELRIACGSTGMEIGDTAVYNGDTYNLESMTPVNGIAGFEHNELIMRRR